MAGSVKLKLDEFDNDDDACDAVQAVVSDLDNVQRDIGEFDYDTAYAELDDQINKLESVKAYLEKYITK